MVKNRDGNFILKEPFLISRRDKVVTFFLPNVVFVFHLNHDIILLFPLPAPVHTKKISLRCLDVVWTVRVCQPLLLAGRLIPFLQLCKACHRSKFRHFNRERLNYDPPMGMLVTQKLISQLTSVQQACLGFFFFFSFFALSVPPAIVGNTDHCILTSGNSPHCQNTIPPSTQVC